MAAIWPTGDLAPPARQQSIHGCISGVGASEGADTRCAEPQPCCPPVGRGTGLTGPLAPVLPALPHAAAMPFRPIAPPSAGSALRPAGLFSPFRCPGEGCSPWWAGGWLTSRWDWLEGTVAVVRTCGVMAAVELLHSQPCSSACLLLSPIWHASNTSVEVGDWVQGSNASQAGLTRGICMPKATLASTSR